ncbi:MAG: hypothetical protein ACKUBY_04160 [Candidatus Moraniibacteriota bacterium]
MKSTLIWIMASMLFFVGDAFAEEFYWYDISGGDTLGKIAKNECGSYMKHIDIAKLNNLQDPYVIYKDARLRIPNICREDELVETVEVKDRSMEIDGITIEHVNPAPIGMVSWLQSVGASSYREQYLDGIQFFGKYEHALEMLEIDIANLRFLKESVLANEGLFKYVEDGSGLKQCIIVGDLPSEMKLFQSGDIRSRFNGVMAKVFILPNKDEVWIAHNFDLIFFKSSMKIFEEETADELLMADAVIKKRIEIDISDIQIIGNKTVTSGEVSWIHESPVKDMYVETQEDVDGFLDKYKQAIDKLGLKWGEVCSLVDLITSNGGVFRHITEDTELVGDTSSKDSINNKLVGALAKVFILPNGREVWLAHDNEQIFLKKQSTMREEMKIMALAMIEKFFNT